MVLSLTPSLRRLHQRAQRLSRCHRRLEGKLIVVLQEVDKTKLYKRLGRRSLFKYAVEDLGLTEPVANGFITVARKAGEIAELQSAIRDQQLSVSKASRIVSALTAENASDLVLFAINHSVRETDNKVASLRPKAAAPDRATPLSADLVKLQFSVSNAVLLKLRRVQSLLASKRGKNVDFESTLDALLTEYIERHDPVIKAERAFRKKSARAQGPASDERSDVAPAEKLCAHRVLKRENLTAEVKHTVFARDGGRCTHRDAAGKRCESDRWLHLHHIVPVSQGGSNDPGNLTTLCSFHHDLVHQLSLPIEGQVSWLRAPVTMYGVGAVFSG